jgi:hypothetical protein
MDAIRMCEWQKRRENKNQKKKGMRIIFDDHTTDRVHKKYIIGNTIVK